MYSKDEKIGESIRKAIFDEFKYITKVLPQLTTLKQTLVNIIPILSEYYNCNIVVHETRGLDYLVYSQPASKNYRHDWPRIDLHQKMDPDKEYGHVSLINPRKTAFVAAYGWTCNFCQKRDYSKIL